MNFSSTIIHTLGNRHYTYTLHYIIHYALTWFRRRLRVKGLTQGLGGGGAASSAQFSSAKSRREETKQSLTPGSESRASASHLMAVDVDILDNIHEDVQIKTEPIQYQEVADAGKMENEDTLKNTTMLKAWVNILQRVMKKRFKDLS